MEIAEDKQKVRAFQKENPDRFGAPHRTRTCDLLIRSQTLYPAELVAHIQFLLSVIVVSPDSFYILTQEKRFVKKLYSKIHIFLINGSLCHLPK